MPEELTNLLPGERVRDLRRRYVVRLATTLFIIGTLLMAAAAVLLLPSYLLSVRMAAARSQNLAAADAALRARDGDALATRLSDLASEAHVLTALGNTTSVSALFRSLLAVPRPGITLSGLEYVPADTQKKKAAVLLLSGSAATRDALRSYQLAVQAAPFVGSADLPVSVYAKDANIGFTMTLTLSL